MDLQEKLHSCAELMEYIKEVGFLPLLPLGIRGWSAEEVMDEDCQYVKLRKKHIPLNLDSLAEGSGTNQCPG